MYRKDPKQDLRRMRLLEQFDETELDDNERVLRLPLLRSRQDRLLSGAVAVLGLVGIATGNRVALPVSMIGLFAGVGAFFVTRVLRMYRFAEDEPGMFQVTRDTGPYWWGAFVLLLIASLIVGRALLG